MPDYLAALAPDPDRKLMRADFAPVSAAHIEAAGFRYLTDSGRLSAGPGPWTVLVGRDCPANRWPDGKPVIIEQLTFAATSETTEDPDARPE